MLRPMDSLGFFLIPALHSEPHTKPPAKLLSNTYVKATVLILNKNTYQFPASWKSIIFQRHFETPEFPATSCKNLGWYGIGTSVPI